MTTNASLHTPAAASPRARWRVLLGVFAVAVLLAAGCGGDDDDTADDGEASTGNGSSSGGGIYDDPTSPSSTSSTAPSTTTTAGAPASGATLSVAQHAKYGRLLVGPDGRTLYLFTQDSGTTSACTGSCAQAWPALRTAGTPTAGAGIDASKITVAAGQVAYNGHLLYNYSGDRAAGDANGAAIPSWSPVDPDGNEITIN